MKYSILVPVYNVESYLEECILSVLNQSYGNFELILVNDGSADASGEICDRFAADFPEKIKVIHKKNEGCLIARSIAIRHACGDILIFLDSDDCLREDALMRLDETFGRTHCDMVIYSYSTSPDFSAAARFLPFQDGECFTRENKRILYELLCVNSGLNPLWIKAVKRESAMTVPDYAGLSYVTNGEDLLCSLPLVTNANKIVYLDQALYYYRERPGSAVHTFNPRRAKSVKTVHQEFERYIDIWQMPELHPRHYAREVRGWVESAMPLVINRKTVGRERCEEELLQMAQDTYFRNAYERMDPSILTKREAALAKCLYERNYHRFTLLCYVFRLTDAVRCRLKRFISLP